MRALIESEEALVTHSYVAVESIALVQRRLGRSAVRALLEDLLPEIETIWVDEALHAAGVAALLSSPSAISLVDHVSFAVMRERGIQNALAFDSDFAKAGFTVLP
jgi:predicted nucleic acid-binding protein